MGATHSSELKTAFEKALEDAPGVIKVPDDFPGKWFYELEYVKPYNLNIPVEPAAVTYPRTVEQVSAIVKFAATHKLKVQARSGGHSYGNYCLWVPFPSCGLS